MQGRVVSPTPSSGLCTELGEQPLEPVKDDSDDKLSQTFQQLRAQGFREGFTFALGFVQSVKHQYHLLSGVGMYLVWFYSNLSLSVSQAL